MTYKGEGRFETDGKGVKDPRSEALASCLLRSAVAIAKRRGLNLKGITAIVAAGEPPRARVRLPAALHLEDNDWNRVRNALRLCAVRRKLKAGLILKAGKRLAQVDGAA